MAVGVQRGLDAFVAQPFLQELRRDVHLDQGCRMAMPEIMHPYLLDAGLLTATDHISVQVGFPVGKQPVIRLELITLRHIILQAVAQYIRDRDRADALRGLGRRDHVPAFEPLESLSEIKCAEKIRHKYSNPYSYFYLLTDNDFCGGFNYVNKD